MASRRAAVPAPAEPRTRARRHPDRLDDIAGRGEHDDIVDLGLRRRVRVGRVEAGDSFESFLVAAGGISGLDGVTVRFDGAPAGLEGSLTDVNGTLTLVTGALAPVPEPQA